MVKTKNQKIVVSAVLALILAQIFWGINTPIIKLGLETVPLSVYLSVTILGSALLVLPFALRQWKPLKRSDYALLIIGSLIAITLGNVVLLMGLQRVPAVNAPLIGLFSPLLLFLLSAQFLRERLSFKTFVGILISFAGAAVIIGKPWGGSANPEMLTGNLLLVLAVFCDIIGTLISKSVLKRAGSLQVTFIHLFSGIIPIAIYSLWYLDALSPSKAGRNGYIAIVFNILAITLANCLFMYGLKRKKAQEVGIFNYIHPLVTALAAWVILSEVPDKKIALGASLIFVGIYLAEVRKARA